MSGRKKARQSQGTTTALMITLVVVILVVGAKLLSSPKGVSPSGTGGQAYSANPASLVSQGNSAYDAGDFARAITYYEQAISQRPDDPGVLTDLGTAYYYNQPSDPNKALYYYGRALEIDPKFANALFNSAVVKGDGLGDKDGAIESLNAFLKAYPSGDQAQKARSMLQQLQK